MPKKIIEKHSPYLSRLTETFGTAPADIGGAFDRLLAKLGSAAPRATDADSLMSLLRRAKAEAAWLIALADLKGIWDDPEVMRRLSLFADAAVRHALSFLLATAVRQKTLRAVKPSAAGVAVIALGKWGAHELNYSSDIDLLVIFDPQRSPVRDAETTQNFFIRLTKDLARLMEQPTADGYVFRTDLRLRPDPGAMPLAISIGTAETYYGSLGQNWERAAMIKARVVAGDTALGEDFMRLMQSWIWRRNLDFAAIQDIHSIKRQINAKQNAKPAAGNPFLNANIKLAHGGIREIEFFAQTQQLIYGGRDPALRSSETMKALEALCAAKHVTPRVRDQMRDAYLFLRHIEHRLQMQEDRQTHSLPATAAAFKGFAEFAGYKTPQALEKDLARHMGAVKRNYAALFMESQSLSGPGNLVFTGVEDDPETIETIRRMGFRQPATVTAAIRGWHHGRYRAMRSEKARQILTEITPHLLQSLAATAKPDEAFVRFDLFLSRLPSGVPIFSMFSRHPAQMELVAEIMGAAPALADYLGTHPAVLDGVLSKDFFGRLPGLPYLKDNLQKHLAAARDYQDVLDILRRWAREKRFHAGIHLLKNLSGAAACGAYIADIAEAAIGGLIPHVERDFARLHGTFKSGGLTLLALGSFGAREMFVDSDLDLVGIYTLPAEKASNGDKPLTPGLYYIRLMQRIVSALTAPTAEGILYPVDTRLRPQGEDGPLATGLDSFISYQARQAWTWEHMSLIRARPVYGATAELAKRIQIVLAAPRDAQKLRRDVATMREKVIRQFGHKNLWDMKHRPGGLMDILFAVHFLILRHAAKNRGIAQPGIPAALKKLRDKKLLTAREAKALAAGYDLAFRLQQYLRLTTSLPFDPAAESAAYKKSLAKQVLKKGDFAAARRQMDKIFKESFAACQSVLKRNTP